MRRSGLSTQVLQIFDGLIVCFAFWATAITRDPIRELFGMSAIGGDPLQELGIIFAIAIPLIPLILEGIGFYRERGGLRRAARLATTSVALSSLILSTLMIAMKIQADSRFFFLGLPPILILLLVIRSYGFISYNKYRCRHESRRVAVQLFGSDSEIEEFVTSLSAEEKMNFDFQHSLDLDQVKISSILETLKKRSVAKAIFICQKTEFSKVSRAVELCESMGIEAMVATDFLRTKLSIPDIDKLGGRTMITLKSTPSVSYALVAKKLLDRLGALILIIATSPLWLFAAIGIRLKSANGPVFFKQQRAGLYGRPFKMWKFRTMHPDAEAQLAAVKAEVGNEMDGPVFKLDKDPRVFAFGSILRKTSIDELPQLINVLTGDMSLVGPRPLPIYEVEEFQKSEYRRRLSVKPGITCIWQAGGRNTITNFEDWVAMDLKYIDNWSFLLDIKILLMTVPAVLLSRGAK